MVIHKSTHIKYIIPLHIFGDMHNVNSPIQNIVAQLRGKMLGPLGSKIERLLLDVPDEQK